MLLTRRGLITGFAGLIAAPAIVRVSSIMPVKAIDLPFIDLGTITWVDRVYDELLEKGFIVTAASRQEASVRDFFGFD